MKKLRTLLSLLAILAGLNSFAQVFNIKDYGAVGDGKTMNTAAIQKAIDAATSKGGGKVVIPAGSFLTGTVHLKNGVELHVEATGILLGSTNLSDYERTDRWYALVIADKQNNLSITGQGTIDGQGHELAMNVLKLVKNGAIKDPLVLKRPNEYFRPQLIELQRCDQVLIKEVTLKSAACWVQTYNHCTNMVFDGVKVRSTAYWNNDGFDIQDCQNVVVKNCDVDAADDGICLKSSDPNSACENIVIENCKVRSSASAIKFGTASLGGFKKIKVNNIEVFNTYRTAIALEIVDGGIMEDVDVSNINTKNSGGGIFIRLGHRKTTVPPGIIRRISIKNVNVEIPAGKPDEGYGIAGPPEEDIFPHNLMPVIIVGLPGHPVQDVTMDNINIVTAGGADKNKAYVALDSIPKIDERASDYPEYVMFGELPAWGLYARHAERITLKNSNFKFQKSDFRAPFVFDDVKGVTLNKVNVPTISSAEAIILNDVTSVAVKGLKTPLRSSATIHKLK